MSEPRNPVLEPIDRFYASTLASHGKTAEGVGWNSTEAQTLRFEALAHLLDDDASTATLIDYGCGYGALLRYLRQHGHDVDYRGYDFCEPMINAALAEFGNDPHAHFTSERAELPQADYCVASGIFSVKLDATNADWQDHIITTINDMAALATRGIAFNALTSYSDPEKLRPDLYYADPLQLFDYCKRNLSRRVALLHDYKLYDFTIIVRFGW
jgi:SAM-dependent methyltransferase